MLLVNYDFAIEAARPLPPNVVMVGPLGLHPAKPLPPDLEARPPTPTWPPFAEAHPGTERAPRFAATACGSNEFWHLSWRASWRLGLKAGACGRGHERVQYNTI